MKRKISVTLLIIALSLTALFFWYTYPQKLNKSLNGILYQLGIDNSDLEESVQIKFNGEVKKRLFKNKLFTGIIEIDGEVMPPQDIAPDVLEFEIRNGSPHGGLIRYIDYSKDRVSSYGHIFVNDDFTEIAITVFSDDESGGRGWNGGDGMMLSAPATNRQEALSIANDLLNYSSHGWGTLE